MPKFIKVHRIPRTGELQEVFVNVDRIESFYLFHDMKNGIDRTVLETVENKYYVSESMEQMADLLKKASK